MSGNRDENHSQPGGDQPRPGDSADAGQPEGRTASAGRGARRFVILGALALVIGPIAYVETPREIGRWYRAAAIEKHLDRDIAAAREYADRSMQWAPDDIGNYLMRARWSLESEDYEASLAACNRALEIAPDSVGALVQRSMVYQLLRRHEEAIADWERIVELRPGGWPSQRAELLNALAYAKAVGDTQLDSALDDINRALELVGRNAAMLDTRGFIHYRRGDLEAARKDLDEAVRHVEKDFGDPDTHLKRLYQNSPNARLAKDHHELEAKSVAVIRYHRGLVYDKLEMIVEAIEDYERVRALGFEPDDELY